jgi:N-acetylmuramic acid 6-phosphate etherase
MPTLPPDRAHLLTEQRHPLSSDLGQLDIEQCVATMMTIDREVFTAMDRARASLVALITLAEPGFLAGGRIIYLGAGTSGRLGVLDASEAPPTFHIPPDRVVGLIAGGDQALRTSSEGREDDPHAFDLELDALAPTTRDTVIGLTAGGTTPCVFGALAHARARGARTGLIACSPPAEPAAVDAVVVLDTGPEALTGSTRLKAGTATKLALNILSTTLMVREGRVHENLMVDLRPTNAKLRDRAARIIATLTGLDRPAAFAALEAAGDSVKVAVVMVRRNVTRSDAEACLERVAGHLHRALASL